MRRSTILAALLGLLPLSARAAQPLATIDPAATMRQIAAEPYRYGGSIAGLPLGDARTLHLAIGLDAPLPDGTLRGQAMLFTADRHLVAVAPITGSLTADPAERDLPPPGTGRCHLRFAFPAGDTTLDGICTSDGISGEIVSGPRKPGLVAGLIAWWGDRTVSGRAWLTAASFDPQS